MAKMKATAFKTSLIVLEDILGLKETGKRIAGMSQIDHKISTVSVKQDCLKEDAGG